MKNDDGRDRGPAEARKRLISQEKAPVDGKAAVRREPARYPPYVENDDIIKDLLKLVDRIGILNLAVSRGYQQKQPLVLDRKEFAPAPGKKRSPKKARKRLELCQRRIKRRLGVTTFSETGQASFYNFCRSKGFGLPEMMILAMMLNDNEVIMAFREGPLSVKTVMDVMGRAYLPMGQVKALFHKDGPLRKSRVITLRGRRPVVSASYLKLNPDFLRQIYEEDYDEDIETFSHPWEDDGDARKPAVMEEGPKVAWDAVILPAEVKDAIMLGMMQAKNPELFLTRMGLGKTILTGRGISMLFSGPPGTGKTLAARAVASELGKKLMVVSYSQLENLYVGETEKNIDQVFKTAGKENAVLLFDEADAVFYARSGQERAYANRDVSVILQAIERFEGVVILTTNSGKLLDPALERRMAIKVVFPMPDAKAREAIFRKLRPECASAGMDYGRLAARYEFSGGQIKNVWLNAARLAIWQSGGSPGTKITVKELELAARLELEGAAAMETVLKGEKPKGYA